MRPIQQFTLWQLISFYIACAAVGIFIGYCLGRLVGAT